MSAAATRIPPEAPFPYFGGKSSIADIVWRALGNVQHYIEPFFGSGAVLLARPHAPNIETVNDADGFVANFWRAVQREPDAIADLMDWPVNEIDLEARHRQLCRMPDKAEFLGRMRHDPDHYDVRRAAWWCWGLCAWIGSGWCGGEHWPDEPGRSRGADVCDGANKRPHLGGVQGVHRRLPNIGLPRGAHRRRPEIFRDVTGECERRNRVLRAWMGALSDRLRNVRVCCGDWSRICTDGATAHGRTVGVFLDPPYSDEAGRVPAIYRVDCGDVAHRAREWCIARGPDKRMRIVLAGYDGEHNELERLGWRAHTWKAHGGMAHHADAEDSAGKMNRNRERLWFSPNCVEADGDLFGLSAVG